MAVGGGGPVQAQPTFTNLTETFLQDGKSGEIRGLDDAGKPGKTLYRSGGKTGLLDKIRKEFGSSERTRKREAGVRLVKDAIDREHGKGTADRLFTNFKRAGFHLDKRITTGDLAMIRDHLAGFDSGVLPGAHKVLTREQGAKLEHALQIRRQHGDTDCDRTSQIKSAIKDVYPKHLHDAALKAIDAAGEQAGKDFDADGMTIKDWESFVWPRLQEDVHKQMDQITYEPVTVSTRGIDAPVTADQKSPADDDQGYVKSSTPMPNNMEQFEGTRHANWK